MAEVHYKFATGDKFIHRSDSTFTIEIVEELEDFHYKIQYVSGGKASTCSISEKDLEWIYKKIN